MAKRDLLLKSEHYSTVIFQAVFTIRAALKIRAYKGTLNCLNFRAYKINKNWPKKIEKINEIEVFISL